MALASGIWHLASGIPDYLLSALGLLPASAPVLLFRAHLLAAYFN
jgi:hypothetical protein